MTHDHFEEVWWTSNPGLPTPHIPNNWPQCLHGNLIQSRTVVLPLQVFNTLKMVFQLIGNSLIPASPSQGLCCITGIKIKQEIKSDQHFKHIFKHTDLTVSINSFSSIFTISTVFGFSFPERDTKWIIWESVGKMTCFLQSKQIIHLKRKLMQGHNLTETDSYSLFQHPGAQVKALK